MNLNHEPPSVPASSSGLGQSLRGSSNGFPGNELLNLSVRQEQILLLVSQGFRNRDIADKLGLSVNTVCTHLKQVYDRLRVSSRTEAAVRYVAFKMAP